MAIPKDAQARAQQLRDELNHHNYLYYVLDTPEIPDATLIAPKAAAVNRMGFP